MTDFFNTTQGILSLGALIGAGSFALGAASRSFGGWGRTLFRAGLPKGDGRNLAMRTVLALDDYVGACYAAVHDTPEFNPADEFEFVFHAPEPVLAFPKDVNWTLLGTALGDDIMWFSNRVANFENALDSLDLSAPAHDGFFERRLEGYSRLAATAMDLIARICDEFDLTMPEKLDYYRQAEGFAAILRKAESIGARQKAGAAAVLDGVSNVTPLFPKTV